ncbi:receptor-type tyrosine-protein phosphatase F-like isoform X2 [Hypanus sabinus]|uniref:receptor-type tyrosine-protein phosphatase F-like isoform X2 n=1 Tax=Hypanus sabinus TaxID=79690 RepID=UPI0028C4170F|nr:receptor-type tyrosine-protein phosphatase F-like isoform X2 [Hypanus sabinus]
MKVLTSAWNMVLTRSTALPIMVILSHLAQCIQADTLPTFTRIPVDQIGISGGVASFVCQAAAEPKPRITWMKKGKKVSSQRFEVIEFDDGTGSVLRIQPLRAPRDEAIYECTATNSIGEITTSAKLTVLSEDQLPHGFPTIDMGPQLKVVERTRTATMLCAASGNPDPEITWFKDFLPVDTSNSNGRIKQLRSGALQIENSEESDQGKYECVTTNSAGTRYSAPANLYVRVRRVPPRFSIPPTSHEVMPGGSVNLTCVAVGSPMPYVKWVNGAVELTPEEDMPVGRNVLELVNIKESGSYTCVAMSSLGVIEATAQITVKALPKPPTMASVTETTATSVTLTWESGNMEMIPFYVIQYKPKSSAGPFQEVDGVATTRYSIGGLSPYSEYEFRIIAVNNIGRGPPSEIVETRTGEQAPSSPPLKVQARMLSASTMLIQWKEPEEPNGQIRGYRVYYTTEPKLSLNMWNKHNLDDSHLTTISGLTTGTTYSIQVLAFTSMGNGPLSDIIQVKTQQGVPAQPAEFQAEAESDTSIVLSWVLRQQEKILKYELMYSEEIDGKEEHVIFDPKSSYTVEGLKPDKTYYFRLAARSEHGLGAFTQIISAKTMQSTPSAPPQDVHGVAISSSSIRVSWRPPPANSRNGVITKYSIIYQAVDSENNKKHVLDNIEADATSSLVEGLEKWTEYQVWVMAHTNVGPGPKSTPVIIRTEEDVPSAPPRKVEAECVNSTAIKVTWKPPMTNKHHGHIRGYQITYVRMEKGEPQGHPVIKDVMLSEEQEASIGGLMPETTYSITVAAYTIRGDGARSKPKLVTTSGAVPGKPAMVISVTHMNTALIQWQPPQEMVGELLGFRLQYSHADEDEPIIIDLSKNDDHHTVTNLYKGTTYTFRLCAKNKAGFGEEMVKRIITQEGVPNGFPQKLHVVGLTTSTTDLSWDPPFMPQRNGKMILYTVMYHDINSMQDLTNTTNETQITLSNLKPDTTYDIRVRAHTSKGPGPYSPSIQSRTMPVDQVFAKNFRVKAVMKTSVLLSWEVPETYKPGVSFKILYNGQSVEVDGQSMRKLITKLQPDTEYSFVLTNRGNSAGGLQQVVSIRTAPNLLKTKPIVYTKNIQDGKLPINLPKVQTTAIIKWYFIVVVPLDKTARSVAEKLQNPEEMDLDDLFDGISQQHSIRRRRQSERLKPYIAAQLKKLPDTFTLGDEQSYGGFYNKPLPPNHSYLCFVLAALEEKDAMYAASPYSDRILVEVKPSNTPDDPEMLWVMGPVLAVVLIIIIVIAILLFKRKRASSPSAKDDVPGGKDPLLAHSSDPVEMRRLNYQTPGPSAPSCPNNSSMRDHPPIPITDLADNIERLKANDNLKFSQEYESIDPGQQFTWENSNMEVNKPKNRYANVIAYDHSRVILTSVDGVPGSDYINANYIDGYRKQNAYIATQGPLPETLSDFWRMVWEQRTVTIVMMTRLEEKSRVKCDQYWPCRGTETYGMIQVTLLDIVELATYSVRTFALYKNGSSEKREVRQFQFMAWPDHGVPEYPTPILAFLRRVKACNPPDAGPMVVHCSAGVGRTGCFVVIDAMLERIKHEKTVDIYGHVTCMRAQRNYMVQTEDQYIFIHEALLEAATCGNTEVPARSLFAHIQKLGQVPPAETVTAMELEFKRLANSKAHTSRFISANLPCNKFKNRLVNIMPYESTRVCLQPIRGVEGSDYINASFIDGYRQQKAYIATQGPLAETTEDFWRMLWEHNSTIVVMLTKLREMGREKCHQYWPAERSARYQYFVVDPMAEYSMPQYILREFKVTDARDGQSRTIRQFHFIDWPEQGVPKTGEGFIDFIGQVHKTKEQFGQDGPITVHCSAGVGRTGVFITLSIVLERMRYEGVVDMFQTVKTLRTQRPAMVQTEDQYQLCYRAALEYLGSFDHYAT